jgi:hypothetical protein
MEWPKPLPISEAPLPNGEVYGPCPVSPGPNGEDWVMSERDEVSKWYTLSGRPLNPDYFYPPLPSRSEFLGR